MRKYLVTILTIFVAIVPVMAQLTVSSSGNVSMSKHASIAEATPVDSAGLNILLETSTGSRDFGIYSVNTSFPALMNQTGCHVGILGKANVGFSGGWPGLRDTVAKSPNPITTYPFKAGVVGIASSGCGVYGTIGATLPNAWEYNDFAGYFNGNVKATGTMYATLFYTLSDLRHKENVNNIDDAAIHILSSLRPVSYNLKPDSMLYVDDDKKNNMHYGLIAQEVREILPDVVDEDALGYLSVNYTELIPLLVQAVKLQQAQIDELQNALRETKKNSMKSIPSSSAKLLQNTPNPFSQSTTIGYVLPATTKNASIRIYDMSGTEIVAFSIETFGKGEINVDGGTLRAGMYLYSLIADGQLIDTKQMILTK